MVWHLLNKYYLRNRVNIDYPKIGFLSGWVHPLCANKTCSKVDLYLKIFGDKTLNNHVPYPQFICSLCAKFKEYFSFPIMRNARIFKGFVMVKRRKEIWEFIEKFKGCWYFGKLKAKLHVVPMDANQLFS